ncbi:MAG: hypothetical protein K9G46_09755 [Flavobacteriales bacterium]|nr:hypothetical protein [Flavobacteriales bacterium]
MFTDKISQRILATFLGCSAFLLSAALVLLLTQQIIPAQADELDLSTNAAWDETLRGGVGLGIKDNTGYFVVWGSPNQFYKVDLTKASDWYSE